MHHVKALFTNQLHWDSHPYFKSIKGIQVSAHVFIERDGMMTQFVNLDKRAWHAGHSAYLGQAQCNDFSIGIELEGSDYQPFTPKQYDMLAQLIVAIYDSYPATRRHLTGHSDIAPNRKTDPGEHFDWGRLRQQVAKRLAAQTSDNHLILNKKGHHGKKSFIPLNHGRQLHDHVITYPRAGQRHGADGCVWSRWLDGCVFGCL